MNVKFRKHALAGVTAVTALGLVLAPATAALAAPPVPDGTQADNGSEFPIYLIDSDSELPIPDGTVLEYGAYVSGTANEASPYDRFPASPTATGVKLFISEVGGEYDQTKWYGTKGGALDEPTKTNGLSYTPLTDYADGQRPGDLSEVRINGGKYSLGFVYTNENGNQIAPEGGAWFTINVTAGSGDYTFAEPVFGTQPPVGEAPIITTTSLNALTQGTAFTQTIAATGSATIVWALDSGTLPAGLSLDATNGVISGTPTAAGDYTFTLRASNGTLPNDTQVFSGTVQPQVQPPVSTPTKPASPANDATKVTITNPTAGQPVVISGGLAGQQVRLYTWQGDSARRDLGTFVVDAGGNISVPASVVGAGDFTVALTQPALESPVIAWGTVTVSAAPPVPGNPGDPISKNTELLAAVTSDDLWALEGVPATVDFGQVRRGVAATRTMSGVKVVDDRQVLKGWNLSASWTNFVPLNSATAAPIPASALTATAGPATGTNLAPFVTPGTSPVLLQSTPVSTMPDGELFDIALTFTAPQDANAAQYRSTLTLTLASK